MIQGINMATSEENKQCKKPREKREIILKLKPCREI
jgi:hypothetical protein